MSGSAWGASWGGAWGNSWGAEVAAAPAGEQVLRVLRPRRARFRQRTRIARTYYDLVDERQILVARRGAPANRTAALALHEESDGTGALQARGVWRCEMGMYVGTEIHEPVRARRGLPSKALLEWFMREAA